MEWGKGNAISNSRIGEIAEDSSSDTEINSWESRKRQREIFSEPLQKFKGVVPQKNGSWGAQIYDNNERHWLGTFKTQKEAARAYDVVAVKLKSDDSCLSFPPTFLGMDEKVFLSNHSPKATLGMIKDGTYQSKFLEMRNGTSDVITIFGVSFRRRFHKELTLSDVGKLSRLVVPKRYALAHFPPVGNISLGGDDNQGEGFTIQLTLHDINFKTWNFNYCYWKSCQSYVITKGWSKFIKEKGLKEKDIIIFYGSEEGGLLIMNHVKHVGNEGNGGDLILQPDARGNMEDDIDGDTRKGEETKKRFKLFGVEIN